MNNKITQSDAENEIKDHLNDDVQKKTIEDSIMELYEEGKIPIEFVGREKKLLMKIAELIRSKDDQLIKLCAIIGGKRPSAYSRDYVEAIYSPNNEYEATYILESEQRKILFEQTVPILQDILEENEELRKDEELAYTYAVCDSVVDTDGQLSYDFGYFNLFDENFKHNKKFLLQVLHTVRDEYYLWELADETLQTDKDFVLEVKRIWYRKWSFS